MIKLLQNFGISANDIQKLQGAGIHTVEGLAHAPRRELENIKGLSSAKVDKMQKEGITRQTCYFGEFNLQIAQEHKSKSCCYV